MIHLLKTWPDQFEAMANGLKDFENRKDDRVFRVGDILVLREWEPVHYRTRCLLREWKPDSGWTGRYSGRYLVRIVTYLIRNAPVMIAEGWCCMQTRPAPDTLLTHDDREKMKRGEPQ